MKCLPAREGESLRCLSASLALGSVHLKKLMVSVLLTQHWCPPKRRTLHWSSFSSTEIHLLGMTPNAAWAAPSLKGLQTYDTAHVSVVIYETTGQPPLEWPAKPYGVLLM